MQTIQERIENAFEQENAGKISEACFPIPVGFMHTELWEECRKKLELLPEEERKNSAYCCILFALQALENGNAEQLRFWQSALVTLRDAAKENSKQRRQLDYAIYWLNAQIPQADNGQLLLTFSILYNTFLEEPIQYGFLSATSAGPSILRGTKDLSEWGKNYRAVSSIIKPMLAAILEDQGRGVCEAGIAELAYEKNKINEASINIAAALTAESVEIRFAGLAQQAKINRVDANAKPASEILQKIGALLEQADDPCLMENYHALCVRFDMEEGNREPVQLWLQNYEREVTGYAPRKIYRMMTQAKAYITLERYRDALTLLEQMILAMSQDFRPLDTAECLANSAVACNMLGSESLAMEKLQNALELTKPYGYIRVYADLGAPMLELLKKLPDTARTPYLEEILAATAEFAEKYPRLYGKETAVCTEETQEEQKEKSTSQIAEHAAKTTTLAEELTATEKTLLQLLSDGKTNNEIAQTMKIKVTTVKFHVKNIFGKLGAKNRTEAVKLGKENNYIE